MTSTVEKKNKIIYILELEKSCLILRFLLTFVRQTFDNLQGST